MHRSRRITIATFSRPDRRIAPGRRAEERRALRVDRAEFHVQSNDPAFLRVSAVPCSRRIAIRLSKPAMSQGRRARLAIGSKLGLQFAADFLAAGYPEAAETMVASARAHAKPRNGITVSETVAATVIVAPTAVLAKARASCAQTRRDADAAKRARESCCEPRREACCELSCEEHERCCDSVRTDGGPEWKPDLADDPLRSANLSSMPERRLDIGECGKVRA